MDVRGSTVITEFDIERRRRLKRAWDSNLVDAVFADIHREGRHARNLCGTGNKASHTEAPGHQAHAMGNSNSKNQLAVWDSL